MPKEIKNIDLEKDKVQEGRGGDKVHPGLNS